MKSHFSIGFSCGEYVWVLTRQDSFSITNLTSIGIDRFLPAASLAASLARSAMAWVISIFGVSSFFCWMAIMATGSGEEGLGSMKETTSSSNRIALSLGDGRLSGVM